MVGVIAHLFSIKMRKVLLFSTALFCGAAHAQQFISLNLCSDRLLIELARPEQIAAQSPYSNNPLMMLDKLNADKPRLEPQLNALLPYLDKTILLNEQFYPQLVAQLRELGVKVVAISDPQTPEQLFALMLQLGDLTGNRRHAEKLIAQLNLPKITQNRPLVETLILSDTGIIDGSREPYRSLLALLGFSPMQTPLNERNFSLENLLRSQPNQLLILSDQQGYNQQSELLAHPILQKIFQNRPLVRLPLKYSYCFDHGLWQGAERIGQLQ